MIHLCSASPPIPKPFSGLWFGPATNPSSDMEIQKRSLDMSCLRLGAGGSDWAARAIIVTRNGHVPLCAM